MRNSKVMICNGINLDKEYVNVLNYTSEQMLGLCEENKIANSNTYSFIDMAKGIIYTEFNYSDCLSANYIAFQNSDYANKWFFGFIEDVIYKGDKNTEIHFKVDSWSTWFEDWQPRTCFVAREHVNDDTIGLNTIPENLGVENYICDTLFRSQDMSANGYIGVLTTYVPGSSGIFTYVGGSVQNRSIYGSALLLWLESDVTNFRLFLARANQDNKIDDIHAIFFIPFNVIDVSTLYQGQFEFEAGGVTATGTYNRILDSNSAFTETIDIQKPLSFSGFTPKNNKLFCSPYNYIIISNNNGEENILKIEQFTGANLSFRNEFAVSVGGSGRLVPLNYAGQSECIDESITLGKLPTFEWSSDAYTNWLTQNAINNKINLAETMIGSVSQAIKGDTVGAFTSLSTSIAKSYNAMYEARMLPNKVAGDNSGDVSFANSETNYVIRRMRPTNEYLRTIDDFFTRFGYQVNRVKIPNITGRRNFNYVEIGENDEIGIGNVPFKFMEEINQTARRGVTIWHNHSNIGNFNVQNDII